MASDTFSSPGWHKWIVPNNIRTVSVDVRGAGSGGRDGGRAIGVFDCHPGDTMWVLVGEEGHQAVGGDGGATAGGSGGHGGNGYGGARGGDGGGGASVIRRDSQSGPLVALGAGAGGRSGEGALGGQGGGQVGGDGLKSSHGSAQVVDSPTGGTQSNPGVEGRNRLQSGYNGERAKDNTMALGGRGGQQQGVNSAGGGGGGGGYRSGAGGTASSFSAPSTGGSGGSNYIGGLYNAVSYRGNGGLNDGLVTLTFTADVALNLPPTPPTDVLVNGVAESDAMATQAMSSVDVTATVNDPNNRDDVRMLVRLSPTSDFVTYNDFYTRYIAAGGQVGVTLSGLAPNTHYYARLYSQDGTGVYSTTYNTINFWTNRPPGPPELILPEENAALPADARIFFDWKPNDPDQPDGATTSGFEIRYRTAADLVTTAGEWIKVDFESTDTSVTLGFILQGNKNYEWQVATRDGLGVWGEWSLTRSFFVLGSTAPPLLRYPSHGEALQVDKQNEFRWLFVDPQPADHQMKADIRYRLVGQGDEAWVILNGDPAIAGSGGPAYDPTTKHPIIPPDSPTFTDDFGNPTSGIPGSNDYWPIPPNTFDPGFHYEWQARTYDQNYNVSDWSPSEDFWTVVLTLRPAQPVVGPALGSLGCGATRVFAYQRGGRVLIGEITPIATLTYGRVRDDISGCIILTNGFDNDCGEMLGNLHCWMHEIVVFRDGVRVWEGPITRIGYRVDQVEIEAKDCMAYVYRRVMRQGYNDSYRVINGRQYGLTSVVDRASKIIMNAMAPYDDNLLPYLTPLTFANDARQSRVVPDSSRTAWEEVDDLAATAGLDYTTVGRRIILWDTHRPIGRLPELRDEHFSDPPIVTEYGMQLANRFVVTNNQGIWGAAQRPEGFEPYGPIELLASSYGETETGNEDVLTPQAQAELVKVLESQAQRGIQDRWPTPVEVRVPDNSAVSVDAPVTLAQLIPGVWLPIRATGTVRSLSQWQKLDSVTVEVTPELESVRVVMSPAPNDGQDPDAASDSTDEG